MNNYEEYVKIICKNLADENGFNDKYGLLEGEKSKITGLNVLKT